MYYKHNLLEGTVMTYDEMLKKINGIDDDSLDLFSFLQERDMQNGLKTIKKIVNCDDITAKALWADMVAMDEDYDKEHPEEKDIKPTPQPTNLPTCPICGSTNLTKLSNVGKAAKVGFFGIFGAGDLGKTWKCKNCGSKF